MSEHFLHISHIVCAHTENFWTLQWLDLQKSAFGVDSSFCCFLSLFLPVALFSLSHPHLKFIPLLSLD